MKCWPERATAGVEVFRYEPVDVPSPVLWEAFGNAAIPEGALPSSKDRAPGMPQADQAAADEAHAEELRRSFESGRERGLDEGRAAERESCMAMAKAHESRRIEEAARLVESFHLQRTRYFESVEREVVKLALTIAARILRREAQMDPLLLTGAVRVALGQLSASTQACLRVPPSDFDLWKDTIANLPNLPVKPSVVASDMSVAECVLESELGSVDLGISTQLAEIERGFFDRTADGARTKALGIAEEMSE